MPNNLYSTAQVRKMDMRAIEQCSISDFELMQRAGKAAFNLLQEKFSTLTQSTRLLVVCGAGNNGGDGYIIAALAKRAGLRVEVLAASDIKKLAGAAKQAADLYLKQDGDVQTWEVIKNNLNRFNVIVDAMLGTGLQRNVEDEYAEIIDTINKSDIPVLAVDVPSGLNADTGCVMSIAIKATHTISFIALKQGLYLGDAPDYRGQVHFDDLQIPASVFADFPAAIKKDSNLLFLLREYLPARKKIAHKNMFGHVLIIGGDYGMNGAVTMTGSAALRVGAGLVTIATRSEHAVAINHTRPELMCHGVENPRDLKPLIEKASVIAVGPGLGQSKWSQNLLSAILEIKKPLVIDADALNLLAKEIYVRDNWVLTPHTGEAASLLAMENSQVHQDRLAAVQALVKKYHATVVLKGAGSLIADPNGENYLCDRGNPGMASAGMGDILTGVISGLVAQGLPLFIAARLGVLLHATAGDEAVIDSGERGLLATDLLSHLKILVNA